MVSILVSLLLAQPPVGPVPPDPFDRPDEVTVVGVVHPFSAAVWLAGGELLTTSAEKDEPGAAGLLRCYTPDLTLAGTVRLPATARELLADEAACRVYAVTGPPADDAPSAGLLVAYKLDALTGESAAPVATLRTPLRVTGIARAADGKLFAAVGTAVLTVDPATLRQTASAKAAAERVTPAGRPLGRDLGGPVLGAAGEVVLVGGDRPRLLRVPPAGDPTDLTPPDGLSAAGHLAAAGDRLVLTAAAGSGIEVLRLAGDKAVPVAKRADKRPHEFRGPVAVSADGRRAACGCGTVAGLPK